MLPITPITGPIVTWLIESACSNVDSTVARCCRGVSGTIHPPRRLLRNERTRSMTRLAAAAMRNEPEAAITSRNVTWTRISPAIQCRWRSSDSSPWARWNHHGTTMPSAADVQPTMAIHAPPTSPTSRAPRGRGAGLVGVAVVGLAGPAGDEQRHGQDRAGPGWRG